MFSVNAINPMFFMTFGTPANLSECQTLLLHRILKHQIQLPTFNMFVGISPSQLPRLRVAVTGEECPRIEVALTK